VQTGKNITVCRRYI